MKSLKESILGSTRSGVTGIADQVKEWFLNTGFAKFYFGSPEEFLKTSGYDIKITPEKNNSWRIDITTTRQNQSRISRVWPFVNSDTNGTKKLPYRIYGIFFNGTPIDVKYERLNIDSMDDIVQVVNEELVFIGCNINKIDKLPENCKSLKFEYSRFAKQGNRVKSIKNIKVDEFVVRINGKSGGLWCMLDNIHHITVKDRMTMNEDMLMSDAFESNRIYFKEDAGKMLDDFFKNNNVPLDICTFDISTLINGKLGHVATPTGEYVWKIIF